MNTHRKITPTTEPAISIGTISALVSAVLALIVVLGVQLPDGFEAALVGVIAAAGPIVGAIITRGKVTPNANVVEREQGGEVLAGAGHDTIAEGAKIRDAHA